MRFRIRKAGEEPAERRKRLGNFEPLNALGGGFRDCVETEREEKSKRNGACRARFYLPFYFDK